MDDAAAGIDNTRRALSRYQVMAIVPGVFLRRVTRELVAVEAS